MPPADNNVQWFTYTLNGDATVAKAVATSRVQQIAQGLKQSDSSSSSNDQSDNSSEKQYFTVDVFQPPFYLRMLAASMGGVEPNWTIDHDPQLVNFPLDPDTLAAKMKIELEDTYAIGGTQALNDLMQSIKDATSLHLHNRQAKNPTSFENPTKFASDAEIEEASQQVTRAYTLARDALSKQIAQAEKNIEEAASNEAKERLNTAATEIIKEASKYIHGLTNLDEERVGNALQAKPTDAQTILNAEGVAPLIGALRTIATRVDALASAAFALRQKTAPVEAEMYVTQRDLYGVQDPDVDAIGQTFRGLSPEETKQMFPAESGNVENTARALQLEVSVQCRAFPVLYRIWKQVRIPDSVTFSPQPDGTYRLVAAAGAGTDAIFTLTKALRDTLVNSFLQNQSFASNITSNVSHLWRYPPLIDAALEALAHVDPSIEFRAAQEKLVAESGMDAAAILSMTAGAVELAATALAAAPEMLLVLAALTLIADAINSVVEFRKNLEADDGFHSVLDPARAPASAPSYVGTVINIVGTLLDVPGFAAAARTATFARQAQTASVAVKAIVP